MEDEGLRTRGVGGEEEVEVEGEKYVTGGRDRDGKSSYRGRRREESESGELEEEKDW